MATVLEFRAKAPTSAPILSPYAAFTAADAAWSAELRRRFGTKAGEARYAREGRGEAGTPLRAAYEARTAAHAAWDRVRPSRLIGARR